MNIGDKVKVVASNNIWSGYEGVIKEVIDDDNVLVEFELKADDKEGESISEYFANSELEVESKNESLNENVLRLNRKELSQWMDDNDANFWDRDIDENNCVRIYGINECLGVYNFNDNTLTLNEALDSNFEEIENEKEDFIADYVCYEDPDGEKTASWYFVDKIALAEGKSSEEVQEAAKEYGYKLYAIEAPAFYKVVVADKGCDAVQIAEDYADYLQGSASVKEI